MPATQFERISIERQETKKIINRQGRKEEDAKNAKKKLLCVLGDHPLRPMRLILPFFS
jgi:hypothetical protein